ncbi:hypothetical protein IQ16_01753 [Bradyrhizobium huanghuaihaiense]|uniref:Uncharacterized protein n=1 Tax=Bradyrhizobium huanghuaihaiense TaxID=990078 RepID=A0A562RWZ7_9BRAD|nr:hypothetical protein [Bradyrhizobium huanghuaihaiense]TWI73615.1 hypothetical protein IQ16_01753 [Bradyrhizobium huanghuaihaiense]
MAIEGKPIGHAQDEPEHFIRCTICGEPLDMRDLAQVLDHLHEQNVEEEPTFSELFIVTKVGWSRKPTK